MLNNVHFPLKVSLSFYHVAFIFLGVFMTGITLCNADNTLSFTNYDGMRSTSPIGSSFFKISSDNSDAISNNNSSINTLADTTQFKQDVSGTYANPKYGITEFEIPPG